MKYIVIASNEPDLYDYLRNEFDNHNIVAGLVECESFREVIDGAEWLQTLYNDMMKRAES